MSASASRRAAAPAITVDHLRRYTVARSLVTPATLGRTLETLGYVQADPIRAPARAQDLTLRPRVQAYRAGDLERHYPTLDVEEDVFINYGFVSRRVQALMHPRIGATSWSRSETRRVAAILAFVRQHGAAHPRGVDAHFAHGRVTNYWGGTSNATTHLLDAMHYHGLLRVVRRDAGVRVYGVREPAPAVHAAEHVRRLDALVDIAVANYAPLTATGLATLIGRLRYAVPQWRDALTAALGRARQRLSRAQIDGIDWFWPATETPERCEVPDRVHLLAPFDPVVWDRGRFERLWGWSYRFEAYAPVTKRKLGYYALPLLWRDRVIGWGNLTVAGGVLQADLGYVAGRPPRERRFAVCLAAELERMRQFLAGDARVVGTR